MESDVLKEQAAAIGTVYVSDPEHPHFGESGVLTGAVISVLGKPMAEVKLSDCKHGTSGCYVAKWQIRTGKRGGR